MEAESAIPVETGLKVDEGAVDSAVVAAEVVPEQAVEPSHLKGPLNLLEEMLEERQYSIAAAIEGVAVEGWD